MVITKHIQLRVKFIEEFIFKLFTNCIFVTSFSGLVESSYTLCFVELYRLMMNMSQLSSERSNVSENYDLLQLFYTVIKEIEQNHVVIAFIMSQNTRLEPITTLTLAEYP